MRFLQFAPLVPLASAFVVPNQEVFQEIATSTRDEVRQKTSWTQDIFESFKSDAASVVDSIKSKASRLQSSAASTMDEVLASSHDFGRSLTEEVFDAQSWMSNRLDDMYEAEKLLNRPPPDHGHDGDHRRPPHGRPPHKKPHHPHGPPNQTVYQLIASSKYTTKLAAAINEFPDLVEALNGTKANYTVFAPTDAAFDKIPENAPKPSKEILKKILSYHVSDSFYPAGRVLVTHTIPTLFTGEELAEKPVPQRLSVNIGIRGLTLNFYSRVVGVDFFGTNGVVHGIDSLLIPPPRTLKIIDLLPGEFSTLELGLTKTGLLDDFAKDNSKGGTLFAPSNFAFQKLGPRVNGFLFSKYGQKYLKALLQYHVVPHTTVYSDAVYHSDSSDEDSIESKPCRRGAGKRNVPKGYYHLDLPTLLEDRELSVDIARYGGFISIKINGFGRVTVQDGIARDGVIQVVGDVLVPPKKLPGAAFEGGEIDLEDLKERLEPYIKA